MKVSLGNNKVVDMSIEDYLNMDDEGYQLLLALDAGSEIDNPWISLSFEIDRDIPEDKESK